MQPTFMPWIGYFSMMKKVDKFVLLDDVQFDRRSWQQRNRILTKEGPIWLTVPVIKKNLRHQKINEVKILYEKDFINSFKKTIQQNYSNSKYYLNYSSKIYSILEERNEYLSELTIKLIFLFKEFLKIKTDVILSSTLIKSGKKEKLLLDICKHLGAKTYVSPPSSREYLDSSNIFNQANISLEYFNFEHPIYNQLNEKFVSHMSIIDLLFNCGTNSITYIEQN